MSNSLVDTLRNALVPVLDKCKAEGKPINQRTFIDCPLTLLARHTDPEGDPLATDFVRGRFGLSYSETWAFIRGFDGERQTYDDTTRDCPEFWALGKEIREKYL